MKKYLVVAWDNEYPYPALDNIKADFETLKDCIEFISCNMIYGTWVYDHITVVDQDTMQEVWNQTMYNPEEER